MKLRFNRKECFLKKRKVIKTAEGGRISTFEDVGAAFNATPYSKEGQTKVKPSGFIQHYQKQLLYEAAFEISVLNDVEVFAFRNFTMSVGDGICLYANKDSLPDYRIVSILPYTGHVRICLEKV